MIFEEFENASEVSTRVWTSCKVQTSANYKVQPSEYYAKSEVQTSEHCVVI
jgi:hypothetical protein